jgi:hypothetical protein
MFQVTVSLLYSVIALAISEPSGITFGYPLKRAIYFACIDSRRFIILYQFCAQGLHLNEATTIIQVLDKRTQ